MQDRTNSKLNKTNKNSQQQEQLEVNLPTISKNKRLAKIDDDNYDDDFEDP